MKKRTSYVSNSSSSSFLLLYRDESVFDFLKDEGEHYKTFIKDLRLKYNEKEDKYELNSIKDVFKDEFEDVLAKCKKYYETNDEKDLDILSRIAVTDKTLTEVVKHALEIQDAWDMDDDEFSGLRFQFGKRFVELMNTSFNGLKLAYIGYSDNDGDFYCEMEHDFMWGRVVREAKDHDYEVYGINEH